MNTVFAAAAVVHADFVVAGGFAGFLGFDSMMLAGADCCIGQYSF